MNQEFFATQAEAAAFSTARNGTVAENVTESFLLPAAFWAHLESSPAVFAEAIRKHAHAKCAGSLEAAWDDALEGRIKGVPSRAMNALDDQFRAKVVSTRWMVTYSDPATESVTPESVGSMSIDAGEVGNEDGAWGSSSYDGWIVD